MKHLKYINENFLFGNKPKEGDPLVSRLLEIVKKDHIIISYVSEYSYDDYIDKYRIVVDDKYYNIYISSAHFYLEIFDIKSKKKDNLYRISRNKFKEVKNLYRLQKNEKKSSNILSDLDRLDDITRTSKKFNL